jgi:hypothetical protein
MGFFRGGGNSGSQRSETDALIDQQFKQNQAEIEQKRKRLYEERLDIIKSQGGQVWHPRKNQ